MITEEVIEISERKALQALASVLYDIAGPAIEGETVEQREERFNNAGRFLYDMLWQMAQSRAALMVMADQVEAEGASKQ